MRRVGWIVAGVVLVLVLAVVGAILAVPAVVDKGFIEQQAEAATGRKLTIGGNFGLNLLSMSPSVSMENVSFANASWGSRPAMVTLRKFETEVQLMPLLSGGVEVNRFRLEGLDLLAERSADGKANWEFTPAGGKPQEPTPPSEKKAEPGEVTVPLVKDLVVKDVNVLFRDKQANQEMTAKLDTLELKAPDVVSPMKLTMRGTFNKVPFEADGTLGSINQLTGKEKPYPLTIVAKALGAVFNAKGDIKDLKDASGLNLRVSLTGDKLETTVAAAKPLVPQLAQATVPEIGPYKLAALIQGSPEELRISEIDVNVGKAEQLLITAAGEVGNALQAKKLNVKFAIKAPNVAPIVKALKLEVPPVPPLEVAGVARDPDGWMAIENLTVKAADSDLAGRVAAKLDGKRPALAADLTSNLLNLDKLLPQEPKQQAAAKPAPAPAGKPPAPAGQQQRVFPDDPLPFGELKKVDANIKFKAQKIIHNGLPIEGVVLEAKLDDGKLGVKPLQAKVFDGTIAAEANVDGGAATPALASKLDVVQLDYGKVLDAIGQKGMARGKVDVKSDITTKGGSVRAIMAGLNGFTHVTTKDGMIDNRLAQLITADIQNIVPMMQSQEHKEIKCGVIRFDYKDGLANAQTFLFETGGLSVIGTGNINLGQETLNLAFDPKAKNKSAVQLAIPFTVGGTLASPSPGVAAEEVAKKAGKVALGIMTGGMSTLAEAAYDAAAPVDQTDYCALALAGKPLVADQSKVTQTKTESKPATGQGTTAPAPAKPAEGVGGAVGGAVEGAGKALQGIFGK
jgi:uncharacterized protein involved in outer membrane biogenesis